MASKRVGNRLAVSRASGSTPLTPTPTTQPPVSGNAAPWALSGITMKELYPCVQYAEIFGETVVRDVGTTM